MRLPTFFALLGSCLAVVSGASAAHAEDAFMQVFLNHAKVLKLDRPVAKVIVGNAAVADATVADAKTIVLTGKAFGTTNLVLLDAAGDAMLDERILVSIDEDNTLRLFRQTERTVYSCTPACEQHQALNGAGIN
ncbi:pilus assembly protein N-terminal domain-containing protein [Rhizobium sp. TRM95796]|uniref:pilus assembly protein N-terminal domain-containing protein n=1 Tax=Rhizobium sp. TRM95796 TaxID=2979862 RepID=UPI0021E73CE7|nr:pilus assembly protein N-terminal domain-containing protein [Rhizobium sp. TRM95796]MCV3768463.1 pilus assembly protein N-terminal domain-containing protein [Rhizobium sp. TRM95796]